jgi:hypothetical protein
MIVSDARLASQVLEPGQEPIFFDDLACLAAYLGERGDAPVRAIYVTDYESGTWIRAEAAVFSKSNTIETPMGSGMIAHLDEATRQNGPTAAAKPLSFRAALFEARHAEDTGR